MTLPPPSQPSHVPPGPSYVPPSTKTVQGAKSRLLAWADETDARNTQKKASMPGLMNSGTLMTLGGIAVSALIAPKRRKSAVYTLLSRSAVYLIGRAVMKHFPNLVAPTTTEDQPHTNRQEVRHAP